MTDLSPERAIIAIALRNPTALDDVDLTPEDFHDIRLGALWALITSMRERGEPVTPTSVAAALPRLDNAVRQGIDAVTLMDIYGEMIVGAQATYYARLVSDDAVRRRLRNAATRIAQMVDAGGNPADIAETARAEVDASRRDTAQISILADRIDDTIASYSTPSRAIPTPWPSLNRLIDGWRPGALYIIGARPGVGKALALDTPIPTPDGWSTMGDLRVGQEVLGMDGRPAAITFATDVQLGRRCYEVKFSDGEVITADADHLWLTETRSSRRAATPPAGEIPHRDSPFSRDQRAKSEKPSVKTTKNVAETLRVGSDHRLNHSIPVASPLELPASDLPIDPYVLGYWLGDGSSRHAVIYVGAEDLPHLLSQISGAGYHYSEPRRDRTAWRVQVSTQPIVRGGTRDRDSLARRLREAGLYENKHIPLAYLRGSVDQRRALLAGILDSDGTVNDSGRIACALTNERLARGVEELARSLGYLTYTRTKRVNGRSEESSTCYTIGFVAHDIPLRLPRKVARLQPRSKRGGRRYIVDVKEVPSVPVRCIQVDNDDHMYLAGRHMVPTHNTIMGVEAAIGLASIGPVAYSSLEMPEAELHSRIVANLAGISINRLDRRELHDTDRQRIRAARSRMDLPISIDDRGLVTAVDVRSHARTLSRRGPLAGIVVDYLQLMSAPRGDTRKRHEVVSDFSRGLKLLAKELDCPVIALSQLNRGSTERADKRPQLSDLRESGAVEQDSDVVLLLHENEDDETDLSVLVAKNRHGSRGAVNLIRRGWYSSLSEHTWSE